ncbi:DNA helicase [Staphylococcus phage vB_StaM_PB50]|nr:DNA helicase [Staphylococcus phage vB_StaM_PB50]
MAFLDNNMTNQNQNNGQSYFIDENQQMINYANISIPYNTLMQIIKYTITENRLINNTNLKRLNKFLGNINEDSVYDERQQHQKDTIKVLKELVKVRLEESIESPSILLEHLVDKFKGKMSESHLYEIVNGIKMYYDGDLKHLSDKEIDSINTYVKERYAALELYQKVNLFKYAYDQLTMDRLSPSDLLKEISEPISQVNKVIKRTTNTSSSTKNSFINFLETDMAVEVMADSIDKLRNPTNKLKTGYKMLNKMINGGFENGRVYSFFGTPKSFKSGTLLNMLMSVTLANKASDINNLDPNKKPVIYYLTMENSMSESLDRLYEYVTGHSMSESNQSPQECVNQLIDYTYRQTGISIVVEYKKNNEVSTDYLYEVYENLEDEGYQLMMVVQDYLKRIRASDHIEDLRIRLGAISDEFTVFAKEKDIPVVTAAQLNREAYRNVEKAISEKKTDIAKQLDRSQIAESAMIIENIDYGIIINRENASDETQDDHLSFKLIASRGKMGEDRVEYFAQPFDNSFKLAVDEGTPELKGVDSIGSNLESTIDSVAAKTKMTNIANQFKNGPIANENTSSNEEFEPGSIFHDF